MDRQVALVLVGKIETHFFGRLAPAQLDEWIDTLIALDEGAAGTALARLKTRDGKPTPHAFAIEARTLRTVDAVNRTEPCARCDGTGWVQAPDRVDPHSFTPDGKPVVYSQVAPCPAHA